MLFRSIHRLDDKNLLEKNYASGDPRTNLNKSGKRSQTPESRKLEFDTAFSINVEKDGTCSLATLSEYMDLSDRTIRKRIAEFSDDYEIKDSKISRKSMSEYREKGCFTHENGEVKKGKKIPIFKFSEE